LNHSLILCLFVTAISLASAAHLSDAYASDVTGTSYCQYEEVDTGEFNDLFHPVSSGEFSIDRLFSVVSFLFSAGNKASGFPLFYTIRAPPF
jgi:hypothetical protein